MLNCLEHSVEKDLKVACGTCGTMKWNTVINQRCGSGIVFVVTLTLVVWSEKRSSKQTSAHEDLQLDCKNNIFIIELVNEIIECYNVEQR